MFCLSTFGLESENNIVIFEISTLEFIQLQNFAEKQKYLNLGPKMPYLCIFGLEFKKTIVIFEISLKFVKNEMAHSVNFGIGSAYSEGLGPGPGPLYKVCPLESRLANFTHKN